jgi:hypothetical protein
MVLLFTIVAVCFAASLLPFLFPGAAIGLLGVVLNDVIGNGIAGLVPSLRRGTLLAGSEGSDLTIQGVLALYLPLLLLLLLASRRKT